MAVTNTTTYTDLIANGGAVAEVLSGLVVEQLYDPTDLRALCTRVPFNAMGSDTVQVVQDATPGAFGTSVAENITVNATEYVTAHFDIQVARYSRAYAMADLIGVSGGPIDLQRIVRNLTEGVGLTFTDIICDVFPSFTAQAGTAGVNLSVDDVYDGIFTLTSALNAGPYTMVLHPTQYNDWISSLRSETGAAQFSPATAEMLGSKGPGYRGSWLNLDVYVSDSVDNNGAGSLQGAMFGSGAIAYSMAPVAQMAGAIPSANILVNAGDLLVEIDRTASDGVSAAYAHMYMGVSLAEQGRGCEILSDQ